MAARDPLPGPFSLLGVRPASLLVGAWVARWLEVGASDPARADGVPSAVAIVGVLVVAQDLVRAFVARGREWSFSRARRNRTGAALAALGILLLPILAASLARSHAATELTWWLEPGQRSSLERVGAASGLLLIGQLVPIAPLDGATLLHAFVRRVEPQLIAAKLCARIGGTVVALLVTMAFVAEPVRNDRWLLGGTSALAVLACLSLRRSVQDAFVRELVLQARNPAVPFSAELRSTLLRVAFDDGATLRPLAPAQFEAFRALAEEVYVRRAGVRTSSTNPAASTSKSSATDGP